MIKYSIDYSESINKYTVPLLQPPISCLLAAHPSPLRPLNCRRLTNRLQLTGALKSLQGGAGEVVFEGGEGVIWGYLEDQLDKRESGRVETSGCRDF